MNKLTIPSSPNWYEPAILACSSDNTLIYGAMFDIVIMENPVDATLPANTRIIPRAHSQKVVSVGINNLWGKPHKLIASVGEDNIVKVWNADTLKKKVGHNAHIGHLKVIGATFAGEDRIISVSEEGNIVVLNMNTNETNILKNLFGFKVEVTCIATCPHATWLTAFGLKNGLVLIADLRKNGKLIHKLRGHDKGVISLSWCPVSINIFPRMPNNFVGVKKRYPEGNKTLVVTKHITETINNLNSSNEVIATEAIAIDNTDIDSKNVNLPTPINPVVSHTEIKVQKLNSNQKEVKEMKLEAAASSSEQISLDPCKKSSKDSSDTKPVEPIQSTNILINLCFPADDPSIIIENPIVHSSITYPSLDSPSTITDNQIIYDYKLFKESIFHKEDISIANVKEEKCEIECNQREATNTTEKVPEQILNIAACETNAREDNTLQTDKLSNKDKEEATVNEVSKNTIISQEEEPRKEFLLASSSRDGNIYIWRAGTDGRMQTFFSAGYGKMNGHKSQSKIDKHWFPIFWATPTKLLSSSKNFELLQWTLPKPKHKSKQITVIHHDHISTIFNIVGPLTLLNESNWTNEIGTNIWTFSSDRFLLNTDLGSDRTNLACYPTFGSSIPSMQLSPLDPNRLAIGTGDGHIRIWDLSRPHLRKINMNCFYSKIKGRVESLAWHPVNETWLAFGTTEGRVGYIDTMNKSKITHLYHQFFTKQIHKIEWGPINGNKEKFGLYAISEGKLIVFENPNIKECKEVIPSENTYLFTFAWKPDYSVLLVITKSGCVLTYSTDLKLLKTHYCQPKMQDILWHPDAAINCRSISTHCYLFANLLHLRKICIYDFEILNTKDDKNESIIACYEGPFVITSFSWSPYETDQMVIATDAGLAVVWDIKSNKTISTYLNPNFEAILSVTWSPIDQDFVLVGGKDNNLYIWQISANPPRKEADISNIRKKAITDSVKENVDLLPKQKGDKTNTEENTKQTKTSDYLPSFYITHHKRSRLQDLKKVKQWKEQKNSEKIENNISEPYEPNIFDIFGPNQNMINLVKMNEIKHKEKGKYSSQIGLSLFHGDISTSIKESIQERRVTTQVLALAPMVSPKLWLEACETYAEQLSQDPDADPFEAVTYYLACHKIHEAINVLCNAMMFKEALALAKCRLMEGDETITKIIDQWAKHFLYVGNYEMTAECYIFLGKYEDAASVLFRRSDPDILEFASELAQQCENKEFHKAIITRLKAFKKSESHNEDQYPELPTKADAVLKSLEGNESNIQSNVNTQKLDLDNKKCTLSNNEILTNKEDFQHVEMIPHNNSNVNNQESLTPEEQILCEEDMSDTNSSKIDIQNLDINLQKNESILRDIILNSFEVTVLEAKDVQSNIDLEQLNLEAAQKNENNTLSNTEKLLTNKEDFQMAEVNLNVNVNNSRSQIVGNEAISESKEITDINLTKIGLENPEM